MKLRTTLLVIFNFRLVFKRSDVQCKLNVFVLKYQLIFIYGNISNSISISRPVAVCSYQMGNERWGLRCLIYMVLPCNGKILLELNS